MDNKKTDQYYIDKIITDLTFIRTHTESLSKSKLEEDEILVDSIMFRLIQVAENSEKLTEKFKKHIHPFRGELLKDCGIELYMNMEM
ncbi:hypothetical protein M5E84_12365 [[Ruminococcus] torques]|nr:hypothetical protein M5E84_12365 [[Ruminococcus] torques]